MYWIQSKPLEKALAGGTLTSKNRAYYYLFVSILGSMIGVVGHLLPPTYAIKQPHSIHMIANLGGLANLIIACVGFWICYEANQKEDDSNFIERMVILSFPIGIRLALIFIVVFSFVYHFNRSHDPSTFVLLGACLNPTLLAVQYYLTRQSIVRFHEIRKSINAPNSQ